MLYLEIDVAAAIHNILHIRKNVKAEICAVIKANCYGLGIELARYIEPYVDSFSVASVSEAIEARSIGLTKKIYILGVINPNDFFPVDNVIFTVCSEADIDFLAKQNQNFEVALKLNTGMNRLGAKLSLVHRLSDIIQASKNLKLDSVYTHFYNIDDGSFERQFELFNKTVSGISVKRHCCASSCLRVDKKFHLDMVRCGLSIYGYGSAGLIPSLKVYSDIAQINRVRAGECVGYGNNQLQRDTTVAIIRGGYADGYRRVHSQQYASVNGELVPLVGQVSMDMIAVDISGKDIMLGDKVYLINNVATLEALAKAADTVVYEILTSFNGARCKRIYVQNSR